MKSLEAKHYKNHVGRKGIKDKMGITLWSLKMYWYISSKIKSYQIQRGFLLLFIFLSSKPWPLGCLPSDSILPAVCLQNFCILGRMHLFTKVSDSRFVLQSKPLFAESFTDPKSQLLSQ